MKILIDQKALYKLKLYCKFAPGEVSGMGTVKKVGEEILINEVYLLPQVSTASDTRISSAELAKLIDDLTLQGVPTEELKLWWHTHANFGTFWSSTDEENIKMFDNEMDSDNWLVSVELNKAGSIISRVDVFSPFKVTVKDIQLEEFSDNGDLEKEIEAEVEEKVKSPVKQIGFQDWKNKDVWKKTDFSNWSKKKKKKFWEEEKEEDLENSKQTRFLVDDYSDFDNYAAFEMPDAEALQEMSDGLKDGTYDQDSLFYYQDSRGKWRKEKVWQIILQGKED